MPRARATTPRQPDADSAWKHALQVLLPDFLALVHRELHAAIDWSHPATPLDKELQAVTRRGRKGRRDVDVLVSLRRTDGQEQWLLVHVEVQGREQTEFARRMFTYHTRLVDRYDQPVVSLVVLTDGRDGWRPDSYSHDYWGCTITFRYPVVKVLDWRGREAELTDLANPFAQVLLAQLAVLTSRGEIESLAATQLAILRRMARAGYTYEQISALLTFLDGVIALPEEIEARVEAELAELEGVAMPEVMSRLEARILRRGQDLGRTEGQLALILEQLAQQCGVLPDNVTTLVSNLSPEQLDHLGLALLRFSQLGDLTAWLDANATVTS
ncbi:MAG: DUF4351 domain-containing protein [Thermomicrobiales bacterium]